MFYIIYLEGLCRRRNWPEPSYKVHRTRTGYLCTVIVNHREYGGGDTPFESEELAKIAAATHAYMICRSFSINDGMYPGQIGGIIGGVPVAIGGVPVAIGTGRRHIQGAGTGRRSGVTSSTESDAASIATFHTAVSTQAVDYLEDQGLCESQVNAPTPWYKYLRGIGLIPDKFDEMNWSGRGQHAEFDTSEAAKLECILKAHCILGHSATAIVEKVQCKRILLARKRIRCNWRMKREEAIKEVGHLERLRYSHIVRGVGTYVVGNELSILLYPAAEYNLESFLDLCSEFGSSSSPSAAQLSTLHIMLHDLRCFFECLANTICFIHSQLVKHMDIKPSNLLVKERPGRIPSYKYISQTSEFLVLIIT